MHGPVHAYAKNGHGRFIAIYAPNKTAFVAGISVGSQDLLMQMDMKVIKVPVEITRTQAAQIIRAHRAAGYIIETDLQHNSHCACMPDDPRMIPHFTCAPTAPCQTGS